MSIQENPVLAALDNNDDDDYYLPRIFVRYLKPYNCVQTIDYY